MASEHKREGAAAAALLAREAKALKGRLYGPVLLGLALALAAVAQALLIARLLAALLGEAEAQWADLIGAGALALIMAALGIAQERAQTAAGEEAKASLRARIFARLLAQGPGDQRPVGEKSALVVERVEAMEGYFARWMPAAIIAVLAPSMRNCAVAISAAGRIRNCSE